MTAAAKYRIEGEDATAAAFKSIINNGNQAAEGVKKAFEAAFAGISIAAVTELGKKAFEIGDQFAKGAVKAGIGGKAFTELAYAAKLADVDVQGLSTSIKKMQVSLSEASTGAKVPTDALAALGLKIKDLKGLKADEQFELIGDRISQLKDPADKARAAVDLFGKAGADLLPLFEKGAAGIQKARQEAEKLGVVFNDEQLKKLSEGEDAIKKLDSAWQGVYLTVATKAGPAITDILEHLSGVTSAATKVSDLEKRLNAGPNFTAGMGAIAPDDATRADLERQLAFYKLQEEANGAPGLGGRGVHTATPKGYQAGADAEAAKKAADAAAKEADRLHDQHVALIFDEGKIANEEAGKALKEDMEREAKRLNMSDEFFEKQKKEARDLEIFRANEAEASAQKYVDFFNGAFDAMEQSGHLSIKRLSQYILAEFAQIAISKAIGAIFNTSGGQSAAGGFVSGLVSSIGSLFGSGKASGGSVSAGTIYPVGERGMELFKPAVSGTIIPNSKLGGGGVSIGDIHIHAPNSTPESVAQLPKILKEFRRSLIDDLDRQRRLVPT